MHKEKRFLPGDLALDANETLRSIQRPARWAVKKGEAIRMEHIAFD